MQAVTSTDHDKQINTQNSSKQSVFFSLICNFSNFEFEKSPRNSSFLAGQSFPNLFTYFLRISSISSNLFLLKIFASCISLYIRLFCTWSMDQCQIGIKQGAKHVVSQKLANFIRKKISRLTGLKVSSLTCKCVFYRPEHDTKEGPHETMNFEGLEMQKRNIPTDTTQNAGEKMGSLAQLSWLLLYLWC